MCWIKVFEISSALISVDEHLVPGPTDVKSESPEISWISRLREHLHHWKKILYLPDIELTKFLGQSKAAGQKNGVLDPQ